MAAIDQTYHKLLKTILKEGFEYEDPNRKGINRIQIPSYTFKHNFSNGFPAITTKKLYWKGIVGELIWFLRGDTNIKYLVDNGINIWNKDAYNYYTDLCKKNSIPSINFNQWLSSIKSGMLWKDNMPSFYELGDLGPVYGHQWRKFEGYEMGEGTWDEGFHYNVDQISNLITGLKNNPMGTRHLVTAWNPSQINNMTLPPCHWSFEILVQPLSLVERSKYLNARIGEYRVIDIHTLDKNNCPKYKFTLKWHQRSTDTFLGLPFNIASYALLAQIIGGLTNMTPEAIEGDLSNVHIYQPQLEAVKKQLNRDTDKHKNCNLKLEAISEIAINAVDMKILSLQECFEDFKIHGFNLENYQSYGPIKAEMLAYNK